MQHVLIHVSASAAIAAIVSVAEEQKQDYPQAAVISAATAPVGISVSAAAQQKKDPQEFPFPLNSPLFPESHPHPQFVAAKSLISFPPN